MASCTQLPHYRRNLLLLRVLPAVFVSCAAVPPFLALVQQSQRISRRYYHCDAAALSGSSAHAAGPAAGRPAYNSLSKNPRVARQVSLGSIAGLFCGLTVSLFSKPLAVLLGLLVLGVQVLESRGVRLVPYGWLRRHAREIDVRAAVMHNMAFKLAFGATFALVGCARFSV